MSTPIYVKQLRLITPRKAGQLGITAEAPVFVSPVVSDHRCCSVCTHSYYPLVYQTGYEIVAHHWHETDSGIYFYVVDDPHKADSIARQSGWIAYLEPLGDVVIGPKERGVGRAAAVVVLRIEAWCVARWPSVVPTRTIGHGYHSLHHGQALSYEDMHLTRQLVPICEEISVSPRSTPFYFVVREGQVFFARQP
jgi:hypothetical protein